MLMAKRELPLLLVAVYLKHSDTLQGPVNSQIMAKLLALLQETRYQFLLLGHWNTPPSSFEERAWLHVSTNRLGCSLAPTCSGHFDLRYTSQATAIQLYDIEPNKEAQTLADWVSITEQYLLQEHPWQPQGRGCWVQGSTQAFSQTTCRSFVAQRQNLPTGSNSRPDSNWPCKPQPVTTSPSKGSYKLD